VNRGRYSSLILTITHISIYVVIKRNITVYKDRVKYPTSFPRKWESRGLEMGGLININPHPMDSCFRRNDALG
jgi:hypothetical protein